MKQIKHDLLSDGVFEWVHNWVLCRIKSQVMSWIGTQDNMGESQVSKLKNY